MLPVLQVAEPRRDALVVDLLDARVVIAACDRLACNGDPVLIAAVLKVKVRDGVCLDVIELLAVGVGEEEEVGSGAFCYGHGSCYWLQVQSQM